MSLLLRGGLFLAFGFAVACSASENGLPAENTGGATASPGGTGGSGGSLAVGGGSGEGGGIAIGGSPGSGASGGVFAGGGGSGATTSCTTPGDTPQSELCGNGLDENLDGFVDEGCSCGVGQTQACFAGPPSQASLPSAVKGSQSCVKSGEFGLWGPCTGWSLGPSSPPPEICDNGVDEDCDGQIDDGCSLTIPVNIDGDCVSVSCPPQAPYPSGCNIVMDGGDGRGCVANTIGNSKVYFQEGDECPSDFCPFCDSGHVSGSLLCSSQLPTKGLDETSCPINKAKKFYPPNAGGCP